MAQSAPSDVAARFFQLLDTQRWEAAAALVHPERLAAFQREELTRLVALAEHREEIRRLTSEHPTGGMIFNLKDGLTPEQLARYGGLTVPGFGGGATVASLAALPAGAFMAQMLELGAEEMSLAPGATVSGPTRRVLGEVIEDIGVAHVLYRITSPAVQRSDPHDVQLLRLKRESDGWLVWPLPGERYLVSSLRWSLFEWLDEAEPPDGE